MKLAPGCYECLRRLIEQAAELATDDVRLKQKAIGEAMKILDHEFSYDQISLVIAARIHKLVREVTHNPDPYRTMKEREMRLARELYLQLDYQDRDDLQARLQLAAAANALDFFKDLGSTGDDIRKPVSFVVDDSERLEEKLRSASKVLYLADNAGELYFDLPLVKWMKQSAQVLYVVKPSPVQNDLTLEDVGRSGLEAEFGRVMSTGVASPGVVFALASAQFKREFESADLIFAKGMGHYEALSELFPEGRFFYCLKAKCQPVADSLGVPVNSYVAMLQ
ncbi:MAG: ARMT1-like domain-containing protein [Dehalococcoidia bacterium]|nr:ARMT1-like domain-containing protein [Dehalococcoidia bacterium]MDH4367086.1 ARMT1-like domain-containing protein [Dehalococcoidia bacterium]